MRVDDPDMKDPEKVDPDLSMSDKLASMAARLADQAASNEAPPIGMSGKTATYHGLIKQGHPSGPTNTPLQYLDKRYLCADHYNSIVRQAKDLLKEDWFKHGWEGGAEDAPIRAALDLSIHMSDGSLYQSKIDSETYDMLLNRLAGWEHDTFSETVLPEKEKGNSKRSAAEMKEQVENIYRIAEEIRKDRPEASLAILKNLRLLVSSAAGSVSIRDHVSFDPAPMEQQAQGMPSAPSMDAVGETKPGDILEFKSLKDQSHQGLHDTGLRKQVEEMAKQHLKGVSDEDIDAFVSGLDGLFKQASANSVPLSLLVRFAHANLAARPVLIPIILAAKDKKKGKKDDKKKGKKDEKGKSPFKGGAPPFKKKEASAIAVTADDLSW